MPLVAGEGQSQPQNASTKITKITIAIWQIIYSVVLYLVVEQQKWNIITNDSLFGLGQGEVKLNLSVPSYTAVSQGSKVTVSVVSLYFIMDIMSEKT